jgi:hypothetical protein
LTRRGRCGPARTRPVSPEAGPNPSVGPCLHLREGFWPHRRGVEGRDPSCSGDLAPAFASGADPPVEGGAAVTPGPWARTNAPAAVSSVLAPVPASVLASLLASVSPSARRARAAGRPQGATSPRGALCWYGLQRPLSPARRPWPRAAARAAGEPSQQRDRVGAMLLPPHRQGEIMIAGPRDHVLVLEPSLSGTDGEPRPERLETALENRSAFARELVERMAGAGVFVVGDHRRCQGKGRSRREGVGARPRTGSPPGGRRSIAGVSPWGHHHR